MFKQELTPQRV
jgi:hypothetical protein